MAGELEALALKAPSLGADMDTEMAPADAMAEEETEPSENPVLIEMVDDFKAASGGEAIMILSELLHEMGFRRAQ